MSHAIRLNLRMQKELQLLLSDPPPGVSLVPDSDDGCSTSSLSHVEARIKGPEGTVYEKGMFHVRVQIPERYPFQPPNVTFVTPVYHPNIDNGGRICLDILNLPPKGAWQPSLNISTVLTSIALLLSEPNPDDGLMCETSREYKYDRQKFDQKARSWTEKYATGSIDASKEYNELKGEASNTKPDEILQESEINQRKTCPISEKLRRRSSLYQGIMNYGGKDTIDDNVMHSSRENEEDLCKSSKVVGAIVVSDSEESEEEDSRPTKFRKMKRRGN